MLAKKEDLELTMIDHDSFQLFCDFILYMAHTLIIEDREIQDEDGYDRLLVIHTVEQHYRKTLKCAPCKELDTFFEQCKLCANDTQQHNVGDLDTSDYGPITKLHNALGRMVQTAFASPLDACLHQVERLKHNSDAKAYVEQLLKEEVTNETSMDVEDDDKRQRELKKNMRRNSKNNTRISRIKQNN